MVKVNLDWREALPHPDDRVEYKFWMNSNDECEPKCCSLSVEGYLASFEILYNTILEAKLKLDEKIKETTTKFPAIRKSMIGAQDLRTFSGLHRKRMKKIEMFHQANAAGHEWFVPGMPKITNQQNADSCKR
ncbi:hypothetical protein LXL04_016760 [Taraxacum kok-saghyz]